MAKALPKIMFVKIEKDAIADYFVADADASLLVEMGQKITIGKYQLVETSIAEGVAKITPSAGKR